MNFEPPSNLSHRPLPGWITPAVIERTRAVWEPLYKSTLSDDEVVGLLLNIGNLFGLLRGSNSPATTNAAPARDELKSRRPRRKPARAPLEDTTREIQR